MTPQDLLAWRRRLGTYPEARKAMATGACTQAEAALFLGIQWRTYAAYERGRWSRTRPAPIPRLVALACRGLEAELQGLAPRTPFAFDPPPPAELEEEAEAINPQPGRPHARQGRS